MSINTQPKKSKIKSFIIKLLKAVLLTWVIGYVGLIVSALIKPDPKLGRKGSVILVLSLGWSWPLVAYNYLFSKKD